MRTPRVIIEWVAYWLEFFTLPELIFVLKEDARMYPFDKFRVEKIALAVRHTFSSNQSDNDVKMLIEDLSIAYCQTRLLLKPTSISSITIRQNNHLLVPFRSSCPTCYQRTLFTLQCNHRNPRCPSAIDNSPVMIFPNFIQIKNHNIYTHESLHFGDYVYFGGDVAIERCIIEKYVSQIIHHDISMTGNAASMNQEALYGGHPQLVAVDRHGHQKCRRRICAFKDVKVSTKEMTDLVIGCCRTPAASSRYCELHNTESSTEMLHRSDTFILSGKLAPTLVYDDGCHLFKYVKNHIGTDLAKTSAMEILASTPISVDRSHFRNHISTFCRRMMNPDKNPC
ncbi:unnamed protein product [Rotaria sordida]|uniref:Uncharacterized protein n=1 Tax=Rotaria sordida TaxID=392033 RepID=A0A814H5A0_9BILA|nr:unnamed protein product [Rotaria sordida]